MSGGPACRIPGETHARSNHRVTARYGNASAFNGYRWTPSEWSEVICLMTGARWRTKALIVAVLLDATPADKDTAAMRGLRRLASGPTQVVVDGTVVATTRRIDL